MSEYSVGINIDGKEMDVPTLIPTLTKQELDAVLRGQVPDSVVQKAADHARMRLASGKSVYADNPPGQGTPKATRPNNTGGGKMASYTNGMADAMAGIVEALRKEQEEAQWQRELARYQQAQAMRNGATPPIPPPPGPDSAPPSRSPFGGLGPISQPTVTLPANDLSQVPTEDVMRADAVHAASLRLAQLDEKTKEAEKVEAEARAEKVKARNAKLLAERNARTQQSRYAVFDGNKGHLDADTQADADRRERTNVPLASGYTWPGFGQAGSDNINASFKREQTAKLASLKKRAPQSQNIVPLTWEQGLRAAVEQELGPGVDESLIIEAMQGRSKNWKAYQDLANTEKELLSVGETPAQRAVWTSGYRNRPHSGFAEERAGKGSDTRREQLEALRARKEADKQDHQARLAAVRDNYSVRHGKAPLSARQTGIVGQEALRGAYQRYSNGEATPLDYAVIAGSPAAAAFHSDVLAEQRRAQEAAAWNANPNATTPMAPPTGDQQGNPAPATPAEEYATKIGTVIEEKNKKDIAENNPDALERHTRVTSHPLTQRLIQTGQVQDDPSRPSFQQRPHSTVPNAISRTAIGLAMAGNVEAAANMLRPFLKPAEVDALVNAWSAPKGFIARGVEGYRSQLPTGWASGPAKLGTAIGESIGRDGVGPTWDRLTR